MLQGFSFGPLLFLHFINDIVDIVTTPIDFLVCAAMISVTAAERRSLKKSPEAEVAMGAPE